MKTLYLTKKASATDLSSYYTAAQVDALTWTESDITDLDKYTQAQVDALLAAQTPVENAIINGGFNVWQRGTTFTGVANNAWTADRWKMSYSNAAVVDVYYSYTLSASLPFTNFMTLAVTTADASVAAGDFSSYSYKIEGADMSDWGFGTSSGKYVTLSFYHKHTKTGTHSVSFRNNDANRTYVAEYTQSTTNTWEESTITIPVDTSGTWLTSAGSVGLSISFCHMVGSTFGTTAGSWGAGNFVGSTSQVNNLDSTSNLFAIANVRVTNTASATDYIQRSFGEELEKCKRYYETSYDYGVLPGAVATAGMEIGYISSLSSGTHIFGSKAQFGVTKAGTPTVIGYSPSSGTAGYVYDYFGTADRAVTISIQGDQGFRWAATGGAAAAQINMGMHWTAEAEL